VRSLDGMLSGPEALHPAMRMMNHSSGGVFTLVSIPNALADALECAARARGDIPFREIPSEYGQGFGLMTRFKTRSGEAAVLRLIWRRENAAWRITSYGVEVP